MLPHRTRFPQLRLVLSFFLLCINLIIFPKVDTNGVFKSAFVVHCAAVKVINSHGRPVCSTDFGHFKHDYFDGLNATGLCFHLFDWLCSFYVALGKLVPDGQWEVVGDLDSYFR
jgi:hypothetical protein